MTNPVTLAQVQQHLRLGTVDATEQAELEIMITSATELAEAYTNRTWRVGTSVTHFDSFPSSEATPLVIHADVTSISSIEYYDNDNTLQTYSTVRVINNSGRTKLYPSFGESWPEDCNNLPSNIVANYSAGDASGVPSSVKSAILLMAADLYENRENTVVGVSVSSMTSMTSKMLLHPYKTRVT